MNEPVEIFLGFDPGGEGKFGWSICREDGDQFRQITAGLADHAEDAIEKVLSHLPRSTVIVLAAGIDAPLFWSRKGNRAIDKVVREAARPANVLEVNSLWGAVLVQGVLLAESLHKHFDDFPITEAHPKALRELLVELPRVLHHFNGETEHEWDARTAAYAAWCMHRQAEGWWDISSREPNPVLLLSRPVSYWLPIPRGRR